MTALLDDTANRIHYGATNAKVSVFRGTVLRVFLTVLCKEVDGKIYPHSHHLNSGLGAGTSIVILFAGFRIDLPGKRAADGNILGSGKRKVFPDLGAATDDKGTGRSLPGGGDSDDHTFGDVCTAWSVNDTKMSDSETAETKVLHYPEVNESNHSNGIRTHIHNINRKNWDARFYKDTDKLSWRRTSHTMSCMLSEIDSRIHWDNHPKNFGDHGTLDSNNYIYSAKP